MRFKSWVVFLFFFFFFIQTTDIQAQRIEKKFQIAWTAPLSHSTEEGVSQQYLYFENAISDEKFSTLPCFVAKIPVEKDFKDYQIQISNTFFSTLSAEESKLIPEDFQETGLNLSAKTVTENHRHFALVSFIPIIKKNGQYEKLTEFHVSLEGKNPVERKRQSFAAHSVLQHGTWYKISVNATGIYKITADELKEMGVSLGISSSRLALFGNGGGMLSERNSDPRADDLQEVAIEIMDNGDGTFDSGDYLLFYAQGPHNWEYENSIFTHTYNIYSDYAYYFITTDAGIGEKKRIASQNNTGLTETQTSNTYLHYDFMETDSKNFSESGRLWVGDAFDVTTSRQYSFTTPAAASSPAQIIVAAAAAASSSSQMSVSNGNGTLGHVNFTSAGSHFAREGQQTFTFTPTAGSTKLDLTLTYNKPSASASAYLNFIELNMTGQLAMHNGQFPFCNPSTVAAGSITEFQISNASHNVKVWDVTHPSDAFAIVGELQGNTLKIKSVTDTLRRFVAFDGSRFLTAKFVGKVPNQDLHGDRDIDMVIISHNDFLSQAERLAEFHRTKDGLRVKVVTPTQVYNEFSSGATDICAIRDYMRMLYLTAQPQYLLLFGRPSYDYRGRVSGTALYVPNYQGTSSLDENSLISNDDFFALLDDNEGENCQGFLDIAVGRIPCTTSAQAKNAVDKIIRYSAKENLANANDIGTISNLADWKNIIGLVADDEDNYHILTTEAAYEFVRDSNRNINFDKIYLDAYQQVSSAGTQSYPEVNTAINNRMNKGALVFMYVGHSGVKGWAHERVLDFQMINSWKNKYNLPLLLGMGCTFGWYDRSTLSPADRIFNKNDGGAIAIITTSRVAFSVSNKSFADNYFKNLFTQNNNRYYTIGELNKIAKNATGGAHTGINMIFTMGDPALRLAIPNLDIVTDSINGISASATPDTLKALSKITIKGHVANQDGSLAENFQGNLFPTIFDKKNKQATLQNDPESPYLEFEVQNNVLFKGNSTIKDGRFEFSFMVPKDINFSYGNGKISYYARSSSTDAAGNCEKIVIGGQDTSALQDDQGPDIFIYLNDENFVNGSTTNQNPTLLLKLKDEYGINTTGTGIGHDLVAILDNKTDEQIVLNEYYITDQDSFNCGSVRYPYKDLSCGAHTLKVRAWDILNNVSENTLEFTVVSDEKLTLDHVLNYPNPFTTKTDFYFEHNRPASTLDIIIQIFTVSGKIVKTLESTQTPAGNRCQPISWDGRDDFGDKLAKGTYLYRLRVRDSEGNVVEKFEKLVIL